MQVRKVIYLFIYSFACIGIPIYIYIWFFSSKASLLGTCIVAHCLEHQPGRRIQLNNSLLAHVCAQCRKYARPKISGAIRSHSASNSDYRGIYIYDCACSVLTSKNLRPYCRYDAMLCRRNVKPIRFSSYSVTRLKFDTFDFTGCFELRASTPSHQRYLKRHGVPV